MTFPSALIFDLDGTLADTSASFIRSINYALSQHQLPVLDDETIRQNISTGARGIIGMVATDHTPDQIEDIRHVFVEFYEPIAKDDVIAYGNISNTIKTLAESDIPIAVVTNKPEVLARPVLEEMGILDCFEVVICPDHLSKVKPDPEGLLKACEIMNIKPEDAIYCGDHRKDVEAARNAGMKCIAVPFGFVPDHEDPNSWQAQWICKQPEEFDQLLLSFIRETA